MADNEFYAVSGKFVSNRNTLFRIGNVVTKGENNLLAVDAAFSIDNLCRSFGTFLNLCTINSIRSGPCTNTCRRPYLCTG